MLPARYQSQMCVSRTTPFIPVTPPTSPLTDQGGLRKSQSSLSQRQREPAAQVPRSGLENHQGLLIAHYDKGLFGPLTLDLIIEDRPL